MKQSLSRFWWTGLAAAIAVDILFWQRSAGISFFLWTVLVSVGGIWLARSTGTRLSRRNLILLGVVLVTSGMLFLRQEPFTRAINFLLTIEILVLAAATFSTGDWIYFRVIDHFKANLITVWAAFTRPVEMIFAKAIPEGISGEENIKPQRQAVPVIRGLLLALPVVLLLASLLASADPIFSSKIQQILKYFDIDRLGEYLFRLFYIIVLAYIFSGVYLHTALPLKIPSRPDGRKRWFSPFLGSTEATVILVCVILLFSLFVAVQFRYFFGGEGNISETGFTYSEYARRGFGELVAVAVISLALYLCLGLVTRLEKRSEEMRFSALTAILFTLVMIILVSAFQRLLIYEQAYGFTRLRTYTYVFIPWLGLLLLFTILFEAVGKRSAFSLAFIGVVVGFTLTTGIVNVDGLIVHKNIQRARSGSALDGGYLRELSADAVPAMVNEYLAGGLPPEDTISLGAALSCKAAEYSGDISSKPEPWQSTNIADMRASKLLGGMQQELAVYPIRQISGIRNVVVEGKEEPCLPTNYID